ncbi:MAG: FeoB-associated Cys-rich membrane protein [Bacteroidales bacterium]|nr:FeoB-associated Cys-rich membrane protein [Bacteroidales bacterium]
MSIQDILVYIIVTAALIYTGYSIFGIIQKKEQSACGCSSCDFKDNIKDLKKINSIKKIL